MPSEQELRAELLGSIHDWVRALDPDERRGDFEPCVNDAINALLDHVRGPKPVAVAEYENLIGYIKYALHDPKDGVDLTYEENQHRLRWLVEEAETALQESLLAEDLETEDEEKRRYRLTVQLYEVPGE